MGDHKSPITQEDTSHVGRDHMYMWGDHMIDVQYKVRGDHTYMWGDHMIPIPYKVWGTMSHIRHEDTSHVEGPYNSCSI